MKRKFYAAPQFEFAPMANAFNLAGETQRAPAVAEPQREDKTAEMFAGLTLESIADATAKAQPGYMDRFFPAACGSFQPSPTSEHHCGNCGIIRTAHKTLGQNAQG